MNEISKMMDAARSFVKEREWGTYHTPKNLSMALSIEASELMEIFLWMKDSESSKLSPGALEKVRDELADIFHCLIRLCDTLNIDLEKAFFDKMAKNKEKYPIERCKGKTEKYCEI